MSYCCYKRERDIYEDIKSIGFKEYKILDIPNEPLVNYNNSNFHTQKVLFLYQDKKYINNMKWLNIEAFKLLYMTEYIQCLYIKNKNTKNEKKLILFSQSSFTNLVTILPFLIDLSNYLKINILTYEYSDNKNEKQCNTDINVLFCYLNKIKSISEIILMGLSVGNIINMNIIISQIIKNLSKIKAFIMISPTWKFNYVAEIIKNKKRGINKIKNLFKIFFTTVNGKKIKIFLIHGKQDYYVKYFLTISLAQRINYITEWYPKNGTHFDIINDYRTKLLYKIKNYINNNYSLSTLKVKSNINKKVKEFDPYNIINENTKSENDNNNVRKPTSFQSFINNNNDLIDINLNEFEKGENIFDNNGILNNDSENISLREEGLIPSLKKDSDHNENDENLLTDQNSSFFSFKNT